MNYGLNNMPVVNSKKKLKQYKGYYEIYDEVVLKILPFYIEMHKEIIKLINKKKSEKFTILEPGFGTGTLIFRVLKNFPNANILGVDILSDNINKSKEKLREFKNFKYLFGDFKKIGLNNKYDYIISSLSMHHLTNVEKVKYFKKAYNALNKNGRIVIGDIVKSKEEELWHKYLVEQMGEEGEHRWKMHKSNKDDKPATITKQLLWLRQAGFKNVKYTQKWFNFYVFYGEKL